MKATVLANYVIINKKTVSNLMFQKVMCLLEYRHFLIHEGYSNCEILKYYKEKILVRSNYINSDNYSY